MKKNEREKLIAARLRELQQVTGALTPDAVVNAAKPPEDILHAEFDWDDASAAHTARLATARRLIRRVRYTEVVVDCVQATPYYVQTEIAPNQRGYLPLDKLKDDKEKAKRALMEEFQRIANAIHRARAVTDVLGPELRVELDRMLEHVIVIREEIAA